MLRLSGPGLRLCLPTLVLLGLPLLTPVLLRLTLALLRLPLFTAARLAAVLRLRGLRWLVRLRIRLLRRGRASR